MHDIQLIRENPGKFDNLLERRGVPAQSSVILDLDKNKRLLNTQIQDLQYERKIISDKIGKLKSANAQASDLESFLDEVHQIKSNITDLQEKIEIIDKDLSHLMMTLPNLPAEDVPIGDNEEQNVELKDRKFRAPTQKKVSQHFEIKSIEGLMDFEVAAKISGSRFVMLKGNLARLERALGQFMLDTHVNKNSYIEISPPVIVNNESMIGTAQLPKFFGDQFQALVNNNDSNDESVNKKWLIPTAEVPLTNIVRDQITEKNQLPLRFVALTPCFRAEAGAAGRDTRGMIRQHQFQKVELVSITEPQLSNQEHERMLSCAEDILKLLDLPYRVMLLSTGDMGFAANKTFDIEVWLPGQNLYREISSISNCGDFQSRRMKARYKLKDKDIRYLHTLNGSGVAVGRALIAVLENYQTNEGIIIPEVLRKYMDNMHIISL